MSQVEIKGQSIRTTLEVIVELWGVEIARNVTERITGEFADALQSRSIVTGGWYPIDWYVQLHDSLARLLPQEMDFSRRIGRATTKRDLSGIYRFILALATPTMMARHFDKIVASYMRGGTIAVAVGQNMFTVQGHGWAGITPSLWREAASGVEVILEHTGAKSVSSVFRGVPGESLSAEFHWK